MTALRLTACLVGPPASRGRMYLRQTERPRARKRAPVARAHATCCWDSSHADIAYVHHAARKNVHVPRLASVIDALDSCLCCVALEVVR